MKQQRFDLGKVIQQINEEFGYTKPKDVHDDKCDMCGQHMGLHYRWCDSQLGGRQNPNLLYEE